MKINQTILHIINRALEGYAPSKSECCLLLECSPTSIESAMIRGAADAISRSRFKNEAIILGQVGIEIDACPGKCKFCSFGEGHTEFEPSIMTPDEIMTVAKQFSDSGDLYALFLMTMHNFGFERLLEVVQRIRKEIPQPPQIVVNIGDFDQSQANELRQTGVDGAYHVVRLREGIDSVLDPNERLKTIQHIRNAGLDWYYCCEPIGPEHSTRELVDQIFIGMEYGCFQHAAMRRVFIPSSPLAHHGQITELRLAQVVAVVALASLACPDTKNIAVHEPNLIGLTSGANVVYAETGANPRDTEKDTSEHRGRDITACKTMLYEAGFEHIIASDKSLRSLSNSYQE